jgi:glycosyltransferase involved in cell wall biosynthesis
MKFGIKELVDSFVKIKDPNYKLILCGDGDAREYVEKMAHEDERIEFKGMVTAKEAKNYVDMADVLVNPRPNNEEYTKYSFPSKNIEYLMTGKPVVAYMLDGMSEKYRDFIYEIPKDKHSFEDELLDACNKPFSRLSFSEYAGLNLKSDGIIKSIIDMFNP